jgi:hypothetical protein
MFALANMGRGLAKSEPFNVCSATRAEGENAMGLEFLILRINISKISLSSGGLLTIPLNLRCASFFASFLEKKRSKITGDFLDNFKTITFIIKS